MRTEFKVFRTAGRMAVYLLAGALVATSSLAHAQSEESAAGNGLAGTWRVTVQLHVCNSTTKIGSPFQSLLTFAQGGTLVEDTANAMFYPLFRGPGHGIWSAQSDGTYSASSMAFITSNEVLTMTQRIDQTIVIDKPDHFIVNDAKVKFFDPSGTFLKAGCADAWGERYQ
ncbi:MAG: hypothetical protein ROO76_09900 [Terriglobia bacterium]|jgi:hypothetical protein|nr:hypothetical protein [Terriglobia bacterium]